MLQLAVKTELMNYKLPENQSEQDVLLTRQETAELLKISLTSLWKWTDSGKLRSYGLGNRRYYKKN